MKSYTFDGKTYTTLPDPLKTAGGEISPMTEKLFVKLGGEIHDDGQPTPEEVIAEGRSRIVEIMADALRYGITWEKLIQGVAAVAG